MIKIRERKIGTAVVLTMFCAFAASMLAVLLLGAGVYKSITELSREGCDENACLSLIWAKLKNADNYGGVFVEDFEGLSALCLYEVYGGETYQTKIYMCDGWVYELFCEVQLEFLPQDGTPVLKAESLSFEQLENGLIKVSADSQCLFIYPRCKTGINLPKGGIPVE